MPCSCSWSKREPLRVLIGIAEVRRVDGPPRRPGEAQLRHIRCVGAGLVGLAGRDQLELGHLLELPNLEADPVVAISGLAVRHPAHAGRDARADLPHHRLRVGQVDRTVEMHAAGWHGSLSSSAGGLIASCPTSVGAVGPVAFPACVGPVPPAVRPLADPALVARLAAEAEEAGWHGVFVWDHVRWREPVVEVADPWITLAAIATATVGVRLGPMVTPLARRRPVKVARETATLDRLSGGRLTLGVGLGSDEFGSEYSMTGEEVDDRRRARMLDESLEILAAAWSGEPVHHRSEHYTVDGMRFLPRPVQRPGVPVWVAGFYGKPRPLRRAARHQGSSPSTSSTPSSSPRSSPSSPCCVKRRARTSLSPTTSSRRSRPATIRRPMPRRGPRGGSWTSRGMRSRSIRCAA